MVAFMLSRRNAWAVTLAATLTMAVSYLDRQTLANLAPSVKTDLEISEFAYGWLASAFSFAYLFATPLAGWWIDRIGARRGLVISVLAWSTVAALHAVIPSFAFLFTLRIALGLTEGPSFPGSAQTVQRVLSPEEQSRGFGVLFTGSSIGAMLAPLLSSRLYDLAGWRMAFLGTAAIGLLWVPLWMHLTSRPDVRVQLDADTTRADRAARTPWPSVMTDPVMLRALLGIAAAAPVFGYIQHWGALYLVHNFGVLQEHTGNFLWLPPLMFDAGAIVFGDLAARRRRISDARPLVLFAVAMALAAGLCALPHAATPWQTMAIAGVALAGAGGLYTLITANLLANVARDRVSFAGGVMAGAQSLMLIILHPLIGWWVNTHHDYTMVSISVGLWVLPGSLAWMLWRVRKA
jgi:MFS transporter, ACS family, hexuronate transporter